MQIEALQFKWTKHEQASTLLPLMFEHRDA
jgi:hypothetical protein